MDWDSMKQRWQDDAAAAPDVRIEALRSLDEKMRRRVRRRDLIETVAAVAVVIFFTLAALGMATKGEWAAVGFSVLLVVWGALIPLRLRQARRQVPEPEPQLPLVENLGRQRDAALAQARMLEQVWLWYLTPPMIGIFGLTLVLRGPSMFSLVYLAVVVALYAGIAWYNRHVARTRFRAHAESLQCQINALDGEEAA
ncbi:hypothetical protein ACOPJQ_00030 [Luteimonas dalianensis]|uniref:hypothetical protein n=1 Tax=Luteimonas dalianensis TaxID=1148196 RepID=UPI003BF13A6E